jgi:hypothetical protein
MITFKIVRARYSVPGAYDWYATRLIDTDTASVEGNDLNSFFERASEIAEISVIGEIQVEGDEHLLCDSYMED